VARAALVTELELLEDDDLVPGLREHARGRKPHDACSDNRDVGVHIAHFPLSKITRTVSCS
jgi:hypothetical protein